jgi:hypothetical protein
VRAASSAPVEGPSPASARGTGPVGRRSDVADRDRRALVARELADELREVRGSDACHRDHLFFALVTTRQSGAGLRQYRETAVLRCRRLR